MAQIRDLVLAVTRDSTSPTSYRATATYDVVFSDSERRAGARFLDTFTLYDADEGGDRDDPIARVRGSFRADAPMRTRRLTISGLTDDGVRERASEDDIEARAVVQLRNLEVSESLVVASANTRPFNLSLET